MQHWQVYIEWNEKLFFELYRTYKEGSDKDPSEFWYEGRSDSSTSFLALKLKTCGVFGVSSDEYLNYATIATSGKGREEAIKGYMKGEDEEAAGKVVNLSCFPSWLSTTPDSPGPYLKLPPNGLISAGKHELDKASMQSLLGIEYT
jgi:hypothetical protein